ncbi:hypothetical protein DMN91_006615 [Ooceraea biroi]|uniref:Peptide chain release factor 1-like, mitochondrial n=1 Tax=Ooceraea biroi TaxID=2015173 RepID=A0A026WMA9_OOCBI|nr:peptide chain release factor 1-like, mitochondrial [Ooceraea biroi]EZA57150.1 Peptide chain release factor 1-like, mitochondrial [Ooceraea biroi]RLU20009.1 hypothetical protein DMN91_006615 [Ooceraea biroi]
MSLLIRKCMLDNYWQYSKLVKSSNVCELRVLPLTNPRVASRSLCSAHGSPNILNDRIRKCLDYLAKEYKSESWQKHNFDFIDFNASRLLNERVQLTEDIRSLRELAKQDVEMKKLVEEENTLYKEQLNKLDERLLNTVLTNMCKESYNDIIIEVVAGVGGQEAMLFVKDLLDMYIGYAKYLGLTLDVIDAETSETNGIRHGSLMISGDQVSKFRYEGGVHRVQRIPATEKSGRVHTSTASVAVLPAPSEVDIVINEKDLIIETKRASGAGGQHVNTTDSAVRIVHVPSGLCVTCQQERSQFKNKDVAMVKLRSLLYEQQTSKQISFTSELRQKQMGTRLRNEKVRTYNYNQDRVTDHRLQNGTFHNLVEFMQGGAALEELEKRLYDDVRMKTLLEVVKKLETQLK